MAFRHMSIKYHVMNNWDTDYERCLNNLTLDELIRAFYIGYEVEESYEVGDWVYVEAPKEGLPNVYQVMTADKYSVNLDRLYGNFKKSKLRHATPEEIAEEKQRRWWAKHGRDVWELREGDCLISKHDKHTCQVKFVEASDKVGVLLVDGIQDEFYEWEH